jgi:Uma2 family endonuclease
MQAAEAAPVVRDLDDFLRFQRGREERYEFVDGRLVAMAGANLRHNDIQANLLLAIGPRLRGGTCRVSGSDTLVKTDRPGRRGRFPDLTIRCEPENDKWVERPLVLIEVLSPETELVDRGPKLQEYRAILSLRHYLLVSQDRPLVEVYSRRGDGWTYAALDGLEASLHLDPPGIELSLQDVYAGVAWPTAAGPLPEG